MMTSCLLLVAAGLVGRPSAGNTTVEAVTVRVSNPLRLARATETIAIKVSELARTAATLDPRSTIVVDGAGNTIDSQLVDLDQDGKADELVFQSTFAAGETRQFVVRPGNRRLPAAQAYKVYGRFVRERHDDFAWENDRVAHRMYGPDLETWKAEPLVSSGLDVWSKRVRKLVINEWYMTDDYHQDAGQGADFYSVGKSRGCGGLGVWAGEILYVSRNFATSRVLANGPIRLIFELDYAAWDAGGKKITETKRVTLDAGRHFNRFDSVFGSEGASARPGTFAVGVAKHDGAIVQFYKKGGTLRTWEPVKKGNGNIGCAVLALPGIVAGDKATELDNLMLVQGRLGGTLTYYVGSVWDRGGDVSDAAAWARLVDTFAREVSAPVRTTLAPTTVTAPAAVPE
jgi:pectinesterase